MTATIPALPPKMAFVDVGAITTGMAQAIKAKSGPIYLWDGFPGSKGYGRLHIENNADRMRQIQNLQFRTAEIFVRSICHNWSRVVQGDDGRILLVHSINQNDLVCVLSFQAGVDDHWSVVTAIPKRVERGPIILDRSDLKAAG